MSRVARILLRTCTALSLSMCVAACALWIRSEWTGDVVVWNGDHHHIVVRSEQGLIRTDVSPADPAEPRGFRRDSWTHADPWGWSAWRWQGPRWWDRIGFGHYVGGTQSGARVDQFVVPYYALFALTAILPGLVALRWLKTRRRQNAGVCANCGYDLRASPERCPECGKPH